MRNKSLWLKLWLMAVTVGGVALSFTSAASIFNLNFDSERITADSTKSIINKMMYVHFADNGNNFGWFLYFSNGFEEEDESIPDVIDELTKVSANGASYGCSKQIKWFYYNAERWERLWPLDNETWSDVFENKWLSTSWGIYLNCVTEGYYDKLESCKTNDEGTNSYINCVNKAKKTYAATGFGYYWSIVQNYSWQDFNLTMWVDYNEGLSGKFISIKSGSKLVPSFVNLNNQAPVWFVYDYNGWVGLAWCRFSGSDSNTLDNDLMKRLIGEYHSKGLSSMFEYNMSDRTIKYNSSEESEFASGDIICKPISIADTLLKILIEWIVWMNEGGDDGNTKMWSVGNTTDVKMQYFGTKSVDTSTLMNYAVKKAELLCRWKWKDSLSTSDTILCYNGNSSELNLSPILWQNGKTVVVKQWNVKVSPFTSGDKLRRYDLYLLDWNLIINEEGAEKFVFTTGWFISDVDVSIFNSVVSGVLCPTPQCNWSYDWSVGAAVWVFLRWNFIINGKVQWVDNGKLKNKYFIYGKFTTKDTLKKLESVFSWTCKNWIGSDGNYCPEYSSERSPYQNKSLIVIDQNYGSPLLR